MKNFATLWHELRNPLTVIHNSLNILNNAEPGGERATRAQTVIDRQCGQLTRLADDLLDLTRITRHSIHLRRSRLDTTLGRDEGGLGLGLALIKGIVQPHGGDVAAYSAGPGQGAEFVVRLPLEESGREEQKPPSPQAPQPRRVLIIEDNKDLAESLRELLELYRHVVALAGDGPRGLAAAREFRPDVILCDIGLPGMDGYEIARTIRADSKLQDLFLVALTGYAQPEDRRRVLEAGFDRHLAKPVELYTLQQVLAQAPVRG